MKSSHNIDIRIEYDDSTRGYYIIWELITTISFGKTKNEALEEFREAAHLGIETMIDLELNRIKHSILNIPRPTIALLNN